MCIRDRVVDQIVQHLPGHAALEQRVAFVVVRVQVAHDQDVLHMVMHQRALGMLALAMAGVGQSFGDQVVAEGDLPRGAIAEILQVLATLDKARAGRRQAFIRAPGQRAVVDDDIAGTHSSCLLYTSRCV